MKLFQRVHSGLFVKVSQAERSTMGRGWNAQLCYSGKAHRHSLGSGVSVSSMWPISFQRNTIFFNVPQALIELTKVSIFLQYLVLYFLAVPFSYWWQALEISIALAPEISDPQAAVYTMFWKASCPNGSSETFIITKCDEMNKINKSGERASFGDLTPSISLVTFRNSKKAMASPTLSQAGHRQNVFKTHAAPNGLPEEHGWSSHTNGQA